MFFQEGYKPLDYLSDTLENDDEWYRPIKTAIDVSFVLRWKACIL